MAIYTPFIDCYRYIAYTTTGWRVEQRVSSITMMDNGDHRDRGGVHDGDEETSELVNLPGYPMTQLLFENRRSIVMRAVVAATRQPCVIKLLKTVSDIASQPATHTLTCQHPSTNPLPYSNAHRCTAPLHSHNCLGASPHHSF